MNRVTSQDGTSIAYDRRGAGPAVILVGGGLDDGTENAALVPELAQHFTVYNYARRGRGDSGDTLPYGVDREIEDIEALIAKAGGSAHLYGVSSGGALVLEAAAAGVTVDRLAVYEVPYGMTPRWPEYVDKLEKLLAADRRDDALEHFMRSAGSSKEDTAGAKGSPFWPSMWTVAHTLAYDAACLGNGTAPASRLAKITRPALVLTGGLSPEFQPGMSGMAADIFEQAADAIAAALPHAQRLTIGGQGHVADPKAVAPLLTRFYGA